MGQKYESSAKGRNIDTYFFKENDQIFKVPTSSNEAKNQNYYRNSEIPQRIQPSNDGDTNHLAYTFYEDSQSSVYQESQHSYSITLPNAMQNAQTNYMMGVQYAANQSIAPSIRSSAIPANVHQTVPQGTRNIATQAQPTSNVEIPQNTFRTMMVNQGVESLAKGSAIAAKGSQALVGGTWNIAKQTGSSVATQLNRYSPDVYDVGGNGERDLTADAGMFILGNSAMIMQNSYRMAKVPSKYVLRGANKMLYGDHKLNRYRMSKVGQNTELLRAGQPLSKMKYTEILTGHSRSDITNKADYLIWNRFKTNDIAQLKYSERANLMFTKFRSNKLERMQGRSQLLDRRYKKMKATQFSLKRSISGVMHNQSRKITNQIIRGNDPASTESRAMWVAKKGVYVGKIGAKQAFKRRMMIKDFLSGMVHPVRSFKNIIGTIISFISTLVTVITSIPAFISIVAVLIPLLAIVVCIVTIVSSIIGWVSIQPEPTNIDMVATKEYATNAFIYEAKKHGWKDNAIKGVLAYMLQEGLSDMGTFTYEANWVVTGPSNEFKDKTLDNEAWKNWMESDGKHQMRMTSSYANRTDIYSAIGLGLLQSSDVWGRGGGYKTAENATKLINYADSNNKPWQDAETQLNFFFDEVFTKDKIFDTSGVDPTTDDRSAEEWCRRFTAGYGMPAWDWTVNNSSMQAHVNKISQASVLVDNFVDFDYINVYSGDIYSSPDFSNTYAWKAPSNPYAPTFYGQCTWFAWGRFYEIYGYSPGFTGDGWRCVDQLLQAHPDKFKFSTTPASGAVFSSGSKRTNHVGIVVSYSNGLITVQEGNLDGATNSWDVAIKDWWIHTYTIDSFNATYDNPVYAVPK